jgi:hypothetical protein
LRLSDGKLRWITFLVFELDCVVTIYFQCSSFVALRTKET